MVTWTSDELDRIGPADELDLASLRHDGSRRDAVTMWVVRVGDELYVRSVKGSDGPWYRGTRSRGEGHVRAGGVERDVAFGAAGEDVADRIDAAYRAKYGGYPASVLGSVLTPRARAATIRLVPR
ncbi:MAG TPA: DUF2255 family protein [Actinocatenispora sp.]